MSESFWCLPPSICDFSIDRRSPFVHSARRLRVGPLARKNSYAVRFRWRYPESSGTRLRQLAFRSSRSMGNTLTADVRLAPEQRSWSFWLNLSRSVRQSACNCLVCRRKTRISSMAWRRVAASPRGTACLGISERSAKRADCTHLSSSDFLANTDPDDLPAGRRTGRLSVCSYRCTVRTPFPK